MKIAIFGDSYAKKSRPENKAPAWHDVIENKFSVDNFAEAGSSLFYSVDLFLKNHRQYDKIIFFVTSSHRKYLPEHSWFIENDLIVKNFTAATARQFQSHPPEDPKVRRITDAICDYFSYIERDDYEHYVHRLMVDDIKKIRPDALLVDTVKCLWPIFEKETRYYGFDGHNINYVNNYLDIRNCHLTDTNNEILASLVEQWIISGQFNFELDQFVDHDHEFDRYFVKR